MEVHRNRPQHPYGVKTRSNIANMNPKSVARKLTHAFRGYCGSEGEYGIMVEEIKKCQEEGLSEGTHMNAQSVNGFFCTSA